MYTDRALIIFSLALALVGAACSTTSPPQADIADTKVITPDTTPQDTADTTAADSASVDTGAPDTEDTQLPDTAPTDTGSSPDTQTPPDVATDATPPSTFSLNCETDADCSVACADGACVDGQCTFAAPQPGCVIIDQAKGLGGCVDNGAANPVSPCLFCNGAVAATGWTSVLVSTGFEEDLGNLQLSNLSGSSATWHVSEARAATGVKSLYFGDPQKQTYDVDDRAAGRITTPPLIVPAGLGLSLTFALWMDTEETQAFDYLRVIRIEADGTEVELWHSDALGGTTEGAFVPVAIAIDPVEQPIQIAWEFDSVDALINGYEGVYVDTIRLTSGCCAGATDCDDGNACTADSCPEEGGQCVHEPLAECCNSSKDCDDGDSCTTDTCSGPGGSCENTLLAGCCNTNMQCNDNDPCTEDVCNTEDNTCTNQPLCCNADGDCNDGDKCTVGSCVEGQCSYEFICCLADSECDDGEYCTADQCVNGDCVSVPASLPGCCVPEIMNENFDGEEELDGWTFDTPNNGVGWQVAGVGTPQSPPNGLYYGNPVTLNFNSGSQNDGKATSGPIELPESVQITLKVKVFIDAESSNSYDKFWLRVKTEAATITLIQKSDLTTKVWKTFEFDITYLTGQTIQLEFEFNSQDSIANTGFGVLVDDIELTTSCEPKVCQNKNDCPSKFKCTAGTCADGVCAYVDSCCQTDEECDDGDVCSADSCTAGVCIFNPIKNCCVADTDCADNNACTLDICSGFGETCSNTPIDGCCLKNADCNDNDGCTIDVCEDNACSYTNICCAGDDECDDGDDVCTTDACVDSFCKYTPTGVEGCCDETPISWDFESPVVFTINQSTLPCTWQIADAGQAKSGSNTLYYGDLFGGNYACGANDGTALSEAISLMPGYGYTLHMEIHMATESGLSYDQLKVNLYHEGTQYVVWEKNQLGGTNAWETHTVNLNAFAGKTFNIEFAFDTVDGVLNSYPGVYIDDVKITSTCAGVACTNNAQCNDGITKSQESCDGGFCSYQL